MQVSHTPHHLDIAFDDRNLVAHAGLALSSQLAARLEVRKLIRQRLHLGSGVPGAAHADLKAMTLISALLAGADCIDDVDLLRSGATASVIGQWVAAPSTIGTFLRAFTWGHARQLDAVGGELLARAWKAGAGPGDAPFTFDIDSTICETYGIQKQGGSKFTYTKVRGYHPLIAVGATHPGGAGTGDILHHRLRGGPANSGRGAKSFVTETICRLRAAGTTGQLTLRADSGFYSTAVVDACRQADVRYSITVQLHRGLHALIGAIPEQDWTEIPYWIEGSADVTETTYVPFTSRRRKQAYRLIVRRVMPTPGSQLALQGIGYTYHAFITDRAGATLEIEADHRRHAEIENTIRDVKYGMALNHMPSGRFAANAAWLGFNVIAHNLAQWVTRLGLKETLLTTKTVRTRFIALPGRLARTGRRLHLHLPANWPWQEAFLAARENLASLIIPTATPA
jgi:hypothetical protein